MEKKLTNHVLRNITVIIPAKNEGKFIEQTLSAIHSIDPSGVIQIILVDNGSIDDTRTKASLHGAMVLEKPELTIAGLRNVGVKFARGDVFCFIDADVRVTKDWGNRLTWICSELGRNPMQVIGARCSPANTEGLINKYWYHRLTEIESKYINSGNMITSRELFEVVSGFDPTLTTAEDYDFCSRCRAAGALIVNDPKLQVVHDGYPATVVAFMQRERWHGSQDFSSYMSVLSSKLALVVCALISLALISLILCFVYFDIRWLLVFLVGFLSVSVGLTVVKFGVKSPVNLLITSIFHGFYILGRMMAAFDKGVQLFTNRKTRRTNR